MPVKKKYNKKRRVFKRYKKRVRKGAVKMKNTAVLGKGFPKKLIMTHKYSEIFQLTSTAGVLQKYYFSTNSMYDPNVTGGGHQPMFFDQMAVVYDHYTVIGSKLTISVTAAAGGTAGSVIGMFIDDNAITTNVSTITGLCEQAGCVWKLLSADTNNKYVLTQKWSAKKRFGKSVLSNNKLTGSASTSPTDQQYYSIVLGAINGATTTYDILVNIEYIAVWNEFKDFAQS